MDNVYWCFTPEQLDKALASLQADRAKELRDFLYGPAAKAAKLRIEQVIKLKPAEPK